MTESEKSIYIKIRAENIKHFQDTRNGHLFVNPYPIEKALAIAENQLNHDSKNGKLRITLEELLLNNDEDCSQISQNRHNSGIKKVIDSLNNN
jgi:hypothetical protein